MPLISEQISNLINGVSQQPPTVRLASQCEEQINGLVTKAEGLKKRPPLEHVAKISEHTDTDANVHWINRDLTERYVLLTSSEQFSSDFSVDFTGTSLEITDLSGSSQSVTGVTGDALSYLTTADARDMLDVFTVADYSFILNKDVFVAKSGSTTASRNPEGIVFIKQATNATNFLTYVDGVLVSTATGSNDAATMTTDLYNDLVASIGGTFTITKFGSSNVHLTRVNGADFTLHVEAPETNCIAIKDTVVDFTDLPARTKDGFIIKVTGDPGSS